MTQKAKNALASLRELDGAVNERRNIHLDIIRSGSPSLNFTFGNGWGLPAGFSMLLWGPPKGGKTLVTNSMIGQLHKDDPEAVVVKFNTEHRELAQMTPHMMTSWGIDEPRYVVYECNDPSLIYDRIYRNLPAAIENGLKIKFVVIDSINDIFGKRHANRMDKDGEKGLSVLDADIGDQAATNADGLKMVLGIQRKYRFGLAIISQQRAEMDVTEQMRGNKTKPGVSWGALHHCEYSMQVERNLTKAGQTDLSGETFTDNTVSRKATAADGGKDDGEKTGHKIRATMKDSSLGPKGRVGEFTVDYNRGIINQHEEVFLLGTSRNVIDRPNNVMYAFGGKEWRGKPAILEALRQDTGLQNEILKELRLRDTRGDYAVKDADVVSSSEESSA
jgi:hypothetical protein